MQCTYPVMTSVYTKTQVDRVMRNVVLTTNHDDVLHGFADVYICSCVCIVLLSKSVNSTSVCILQTLGENGTYPNLI